MKKFILLICIILFSQASFASYHIGEGIYDITGPAAEVGMMGYGKSDQITTGIHTRLRSRAFIFVDSNTQKRVVFISADLGMIFQSIKQGVISELQKRYGNLYNDENVMLSAIHTHSGPGGYAHEILFNITTLGFVPENYNVIVSGIVESIVRAHDNLQPGKILINRGELTDASLNRSAIAYQNNPVVEREKYQNPFDTRMTLLRLEGKDSEIGMINWFALHNVSMSSLNKLISGDNKGYASYLFEKDKGVDYLNTPQFVAAFAQSNEGDVSPTIDYEDDPIINDFKRTENAAFKQYEAAKTLYNEATEVLEGPIEYKHAYINLENIIIQNNHDKRNKTTTGALGYSFAAGTINGRGPDFFEQGTFKSNPFISAVTGIVAQPSEQLKALQFPKPILVLTGSAIPTPWTPAILPIQLFKIGKLVLIGVPGEFTTMSGRRLRETIKNVFGDDVTDVVIAGLSNSYSGYITTPEEYDTQRYEGGFTLFGSQTLPAYLQEFKQLAYELKTQQHTMPHLTPPDYSKSQLTFQSSILFDDVPLTHKFGDVIQEPLQKYKARDRVSVKFWGGHPKNNLKQNDTYLLVERKNNDQWIKVADDGDWSTTYEWKRVGTSYSEIQISWKIPNNIEIGEYRIRHFGDYKYAWNGKIYPYEGISKSFYVN